MLFALSLPAAGLALCALFLSVTAMPLEARWATYNVTCGAIETTRYCVDSFFLGCSITGEIGIEQAHFDPGSVLGETCNECTCTPPPAPEPASQPASQPVPPPAPAQTLPPAQTPPPAPSCVGTIHANPAAQEALPIPNQDWCTRPEVNAVCDAGKVNVLGKDGWKVCKLSCKC